MKCPFCAHPDTQVAETREADEGASVRRRRRCAACDKRFTTYERAEMTLPMIVKKDGRRVEYERQKLLSSLKLALRKRPVSTEQIHLAVQSIEEQLLYSGQRELPSSRLGEWVMLALQKLDQVAYVRFASVYRSFEDVDQFRALVDEVRK